jgi:putative transposase of IS4/5 family DUF4096
VFDNRQLAILWKLKMTRSQRVHYDENVIQYVPNQGVFLWRKRTDGVLCDAHLFLMLKVNFQLGRVLNWKLIRLENWRRASRMKRYGLRDDPWEPIKDLLPGRAGHVGVTARNNRRFVEAVLYRYRTGIAWRDLAQRLGHCKAIHTRLSRWAKL